MHPGSQHLRAGKGGSAGRLSGLAGADRIFGAHGRDIVNAGPGDDQIDVRGDGLHEPDKVSCGPGTDSVRADRRDRLVGCGTVERSR